MRVHAFVMVLLLVTSHADSSLRGAQLRDAQLKILVLEGQGAINNISLRRSKEPVVEVTNENDAPVAGAVVTFMLPDAGPGGVFGDNSRILSVTTDEKGQAVGRGLRPNKVIGQDQILVSASYQGRSARTSITQTNAEPAAAVSHGSSKKLLWLVLVAGGAAGAAFAARGSASSPATATPSGSTPSGAVITPGSPVFQPPH
jgi:hypothetical protein